MDASFLYMMARGLVSLLLIWLGIRWFEQRSVYVPSRTLDASPADVGLARQAAVPLGF